jgi:beta-galactosidase
VEFVKSAARGKRVWLSELQGGRAAQGFSKHAPVDALSQQRWVWNGLACGADTILFWCWRDEVFCREAGGFGLIGQDGFADERLAAMRITGRALEQHANLLAAYLPARAEVGVLFSPQTYYHHWASEYRAKRAYESLVGYARALVRRSIPYTVVEEEHLDALDGLKILFLPSVTAVSPELEAALERFVRSGGTLVCESECGAFTPEGFYRYPADRFTARLAGRAEVGRRALPGDTVTVTLAGESLELDVAQWLTPWESGPGQSLAAGQDGDLAVDMPVDKGHLILCGTYFGEEYSRRQHSGKPEDRTRCPNFERFVELLARSAGWVPELEILEPQPTPAHRPDGSPGRLGDDAFLYVKSGIAGRRRVVFVFFQEGQASARLRTQPGFFATGRLTDLLTGSEVAAVPGPDGAWTLELTVPEWRFAVLAETD